MPSPMEAQKIDRNSETTTSQIDRISELPDSVISRILFYLPAEDAARTTVLSRNWLRIWHSLVQDFVFDESLFENNLRLQHELEGKEKVQKFIDFVNESISILLQQKVVVQNFTLNLINYGDSFCFQNTIMHWLLLVTKNGVKNITLNKAASRPLLEGVFLWLKKQFGHLQRYRLLRPDFDNVKVKGLETKLFQRLKCLQELSLTLDNMNKFELQNGLDYILSFCSSLETLILKGNIYIDSVSLEKPGVKNIRVENISRLHLYDATLDRLHISSPDLQHFEINFDPWETSKDEIVIHIDAPNLRQLLYRARVMVSFTSDVLKFSGLEYCNLEISPRHDLNTSWFIQLRKHLEKFSNVNLTIRSYDSDALFQWHETMNQSQEGSGRIFSPPNIRSLRIECFRSFIADHRYDDLIDGLLWSCRPDTITAYASYWARPFLGFFSGELKKIMTEETLSCCRNRRGFKCWRHYARFSDISIEWEERSFDARCLCWSR